MKGGTPHLLFFYLFPHECFTGIPLNNAHGNPLKTSPMTPTKSRNFWTGGLQRTQQLMWSPLIHMKPFSCIAHLFLPVQVLLGQVIPEFFFHHSHIPPPYNNTRFSTLTQLRAHTYWLYILDHPFSSTRHFKPFSIS